MDDPIGHELHVGIWRVGQRLGGEQRRHLALGEIAQEGQHLAPELVRIGGQEAQLCQGVQHHALGAAALHAFGDTARN